LRRLAIINCKCGRLFHVGITIENVYINSD
jgi:hypothetical protein